MPPSTVSTGCRSYSNDTTTPKLPPPPRSAQNRSGSASASTVRNVPSAVMRSAERRLSIVRPCLPISQPRPPPRVSPAMPVFDTVPPVVASPNACVSRSSSRHRTPPCAVAVRAVGSTRMPFIGLRSMTNPPSFVAIARRAVPAAADRHHQAVLDGERQRPLHVRHSPAAGDHRRTAIDVAVPHPPRRVVAVIGAPQQLAAEDRSQGVERTVVDDRDIHEHLAHLDHPSIERPATPNDGAIDIFVLTTSRRNPTVPTIVEREAGHEAEARRRRRPPDSPALAHDRLAAVASRKSTPAARDGATFFRQPASLRRQRLSGGREILPGPASCWRPSGSSMRRSSARRSPRRRVGAVAATSTSRPPEDHPRRAPAPPPGNSCAVGRI